MECARINPKLMLIVPLMAMLIVPLMAMLMAVGTLLPRLHEPVVARPGHYETAARQWQAEQARRIIHDPGSPCRYYDCSTSNSTLRVCKGSVLQDGVEITVQALQWVWYDSTGGQWLEGTAFLQDKPHKVENYLRNNGCEEVVR